MAKQKVHLVLGSGGARGMAHIGVIEELEKEGYEIIEVIGCSMGAVVGGIYCAGELQQYHKWLLTLTKAAVWKLLDFTLTRHGFVKGEKIFDNILDITGPRKIEELPIPFAAVATDLVRTKEVIFREGDLFQALRASVSIPGIFTPVKNNGSVLVDGGVLNPLPLSLVKKQEDAIIIAVNINAQRDSHTEPEMIKDEGYPNTKTDSEKETNLGNWISSHWPFAQKENSTEEPVDFSLVELLQTSYDYTQDQLAKMTIMHYHPDILVNVPRSTCGIFEFYRAAEVIELGRDACRNSLRAVANK